MQFANIRCTASRVHFLSFTFWGKNINKKQKIIGACILPSGLERELEAAEEPKISSGPQNSAEILERLMLASTTSGNVATTSTSVASVAANKKPMSREAAAIIESFPLLNFMQSSVLMFPIKTDDGAQQQQQQRYLRPQNTGASEVPPTTINAFAN